MDELIQRAAHGRAEGLRALGATAQLDLLRFRRLVAFGARVEPQTAPLTNFLLALKVFADAFDTGGGARLLLIARPPILLGLYGPGGPSPAERTLVSLIGERGQLAEKLDCLLLRGCTSDEVKNQVILDKVLYDVDRAIDLYALGTEDFEEPQVRAKAYHYLIEKVIVLTTNTSRTLPSAITDILEKIMKNLEPVRTDLSLIRQELCIQQDAENRWKNLVKTMAPDCIGIDALFGKDSDLMTIITWAIAAASNIYPAANVPPCEPIDLQVPPESAVSEHRTATEVEKIRKKLESDDSKPSTPLIQRP